MNKFKKLRKGNNITVAESAKELGISQSMLTNYENGNGAPRDDSVWKKLSQIFWGSKSHVMGLTTDIDILTKLDLLDEDDTEEMLNFINTLLDKDKYEGRRETPIEYVVE